MTKDDDTKNQDTQAFDLKSGSTDAKTISAYYDKWASTYDETLNSWNYRTPSDAAKLLAPELEPGAFVLDVGCGTGLFGDALARGGDFRIMGMDISRGSIEMAKSRWLYDGFIEHDLQNRPLPVLDNAMDAAACVGVLTYVEDAGALLQDICRCVRPGGSVIFTQRTDRWEMLDFGKTVTAMEDADIWDVVKITDPMNYLPGHEDFGDEIKVHHVLCKVL
ncbi:hypothetical protein AYJ57_21000 (plasmid) [Salipiger sp. CCB-MM3]|uniref:class I SAM-dependent DNA methyltransferase n=1 Tax=Salipiger sp. CCB-MM3 TaxID=1792508 RepID=UPI00080AB552|nr:class I SAM-dependent methyltransferase [Salipiger sp. CCB-MM3]ANT62957.1 hypothetical protein AYJ57_21000 [Salipiger sp. CCB-MM3]